ncbi:MAG: nucleotide exchange factor GrpE [Anaerolineales bacterium]|nr:MAG: nucleotide exchange factor GrpE [Anaerolineales bacterium]
MSGEKLEEAVEPLSGEVSATEEEQERETEEYPAPEETPAEAKPRPEQDEGPTEEIDELPALRQELEEQKSKAAEYLDGWQRARAEFANYKKRIEKEQEDMVKFANGAFIARLLPVMDDFERAFQTLPLELMGMTWLEGIALVQRKLQMLLEQEGVTVIETEGQMFDPTLHQAVTHEESEEHEEGQIVGEVQKGYKMGDKILRPSLVRVAKRISDNE